MDEIAEIFPETSLFCGLFFDGTKFKSDFDQINEIPLIRISFWRPAKRLRCQPTRYGRLDNTLGFAFGILNAPKQ